MSALDDFVKALCLIDDEVIMGVVKMEINDLRNKVASLESRLAEALERNAKLQDELGRSFDNDFGKYKTHHR